jgi:ribosomal protein L37E
MRPCRECGKEISEQAAYCPHCGAPYPARAKWDGWGFEYKSQANFLGLPLLHVSFKYRPNRVPVVAKGVISIGQFGMGIINISQFGIGLISISQFTIGVFALAQFAFAWKLIAQIGIYIEEGRGQLVWSLQEIIRLLQ